MDTVFLAQPLAQCSRSLGDVATVRLALGPGDGCRMADIAIVRR